MKRIKDISEHKHALLGVFLTIILGALAYNENSTIGFPDGHLTEYDRFCKNILYPIFFLLNALFALSFIISVSVKKKQKWILYLYIIFFVTYAIIKYYFSVNLENGQGG